VGIQGEKLHTSVDRRRGDERVPGPEQRMARKKICSSLVYLPVTFQERKSPQPRDHPLPHCGTTEAADEFDPDLSADGGVATPADRKSDRIQ
jgi:hypothetical protein